MNSKTDNREVIDSVSTCQMCFQACFKVPVEPPHKTICLWAVCCDAGHVAPRRFMREYQRSDSNCCPWSEVIIIGTPKGEIQPVRRA